MMRLTGLCSVWCQWLGQQLRCRQCVVCELWTFHQLLEWNAKCPGRQQGSLPGRWSGTDLSSCLRVCRQKPRQNEKLGRRHSHSAIVAPSRIQSAFGRQRTCRWSQGLGSSTFQKVSRTTLLSSVMSDQKTVGASAHQTSSCARRNARMSEGVTVCCLSSLEQSQACQQSEDGMLGMWSQAGTDASYRMWCAGCFWTVLGEMRTVLVVAVCRNFVKAWRLCRPGPFV